MKSINLFFFLILISAFSFAQNGRSEVSNKQNTLAKFTITESTFNGIDNTEFDINRGGYFVFYLTTNGELFMANASTKTNDQSFGKLYLDSNEDLPETDTSYKISIFNFRWHFYNNYDTKSGYVTGSLSKIYKPQGVLFIMKMVLPNLDARLYKGYMEGTLNFKEYFK